MDLILEITQLTHWESEMIEISIIFIICLFLDISEKSISQRGKDQSIGSLRPSRFPIYPQVK